MILCSFMLAVSLQYPLHYLPSCHIGQTRLGNTAVCDCFDEVISPERLAIRHRHIKTGLGCCHARVLSTPVSHDESIKAELGLEESVQGLAVLTGVGVVDTVV